MHPEMKCNRCRLEFDERLLRPPAPFFRTVAGPFFSMFFPRSPELRQEFVATYCPLCRRRLNFCFFFAAFMVVTVAIWAFVLALVRAGVLR